MLEMGMTMTQKILAHHAGEESLTPGQLINAKLDIVLGNDITTPVAIKEFEKNGFKDVVIVIREENEKKRNALKRKFTCDDGIKQIGLTLCVIEGAETIELTMDMLDEETREDIECGLLDFEEVKRELGGRAIGDRISELRFAELTPKKNVAQDTVYSVEDMHPAREDVVEEEDEDTTEVDLFDDDDEL